MTSLSCVDGWRAQCSPPERHFSRLSAAVFMVGVLVLGWASTGSAEPLVMHVEPLVGLPLSAPQSEEFGLGGGLGAGILYPAIPQVAVGVRVQGLALSNNGGPQAPGRIDNGYGALFSGEVMLRLRPFSGARESRSSGFFVEAGLGGGITGELPRAVFSGALGWGISIGEMTVAPVVRYLQVVQKRHALVDRDARLASLGVQVSFGGMAPKEEPEVEEFDALPPPAPDADGDGIPDSEDACVQVSEDADGFEDSDGCPDTDNDGDDVPDVDDSCPDEPEDRDDFHDSDGCPDPDNDEDGFSDADDQCPDEAEVVNGNKDYDGCPDEGLIEFKDDRIVLEERVLFDMERARIRRAARPLLKAIVRLRKQHPEWIKIRIEGHADARGDTKYNTRLSERRAENVRLMLVELGIPSALMESEGYGSTRLRDRRDDGDAHRRNRRVEFVVVARSATPVQSDTNAGHTSSTVAPSSKSEASAAGTAGVAPKFPEGEGPVPAGTPLEAAVQESP